MTVTELHEHLESMMACNPAIAELPVRVVRPNEATPATPVDGIAYHAFLGEVVLVAQVPYTVVERAKPGL
jgi:hypothetical protein